MKKHHIVIAVSIYAAIVAVAFVTTLRGGDPIERGWAHYDDGEYEEAVAAFTEAVEAAPDDPAGWLGRAEAYAFRDPDRSAADYQAALDLLRGTGDPRLGNAQLGLGAQRCAANRTDEAIAILQAVITRDPTEYRAHYYLGLAYQQQHDHRRALQAFDTVLSNRPDDPGSLNGYAWLLATAPDAELRDGARAVELARRAAEATDWKNAPILDTVAAAFAEHGRWEEAVSWQQRALELAEERHREGMRERLALYRAHEPYREH